MSAATNYLLVLFLAFAAVGLCPATSICPPNQYRDEEEEICLRCETCFTGWSIVSPCSDNANTVCRLVTSPPTAATSPPTAATPSPTAATPSPAATPIITSSPTPQISSPTSIYDRRTSLLFRPGVSTSPSTTSLTGAAATSTEGSGGGLLYIIIGGGVIGIVLLVGFFVGPFRWYRARSGRMAITSPSKTDDLESGEHGSDPKPVPSKGTPDEVLEIRNKKHDDDGKAIETDDFQLIQSNVTPELSRDGSQRSASSTATTSTGKTLTTVTDCDSAGSPTSNVVGGSGPKAVASTARPQHVTHSTPVTSQVNNPAGSSDPPITMHGNGNHFGNIIGNGNHFGPIINFNFSGRASSDDQSRAPSPTCETGTCQGEQVVGCSYQPVASASPVIPQQDTNPPTQVEEANSAADS